MLSNGFAADGEAAALVVGQSKSSTTELLLEDTILLSEVLDARILLTADPAGKGRDKNLPGLNDGGHSLIVAS